MAWTPAQERAINARNCDMLVAAGAGSGKTAVLVQRIISLVQEGADIERMLIVTFTRAAASEMSDRLAKEFGKHEDDPRMLRQALACAHAHIQTLHSFCEEICRAEFQTADVDPGFRVADQSEAEQLASRALDDALQLFYGELDEDARQLDALRGQERLREFARETYRFMGAMEDGEGWLDALCDDSRFQAARDYLQSRVVSICRESRRLMEDTRAFAERDSSAYIYAEALKRDLAIWPDGGDAEAVRNFALPRLSGARGEKGAASTNSSTWVKARRKQAGELIKRAQQYIDMLRQETPQDVEYLRAVTRGLAKLVRLYAREYTRRKRERGVIDFNDMEHCALRALSDPGIAQNVRDRFDYVFVDEYQDISPVQERLLDTVSKPRARFMVGDVKQSIYRFRQAEPALFTHKYDTYPTEEGGAELRIDLNRNFRSRANVLNYINGIFSRVMSRELYEIEYDEDAALYPGFTPRDDDPPVEMHLMEKGDAGDAEADDADDGDEDEDALSAADDASERLISQLVRENLGKQFYDGKDNCVRAVRPRDIVILSRSIKAVGPKLLAALLDEGVPAISDMTGAHLDAMEVRQALALMRVLDNRLRDVDLLTVMHSPMFGFTSAELAELRAHCREGAYLDAVERCAAEADELPPSPLKDAAQKARRMLAQLDAWQRDACFMPLSELIWLLLDDTGYYTYAGALPDGGSRQKNLRLLCQRAAQYESTQHGGLHGFLSYVENLRATGNDVAAAAELGEADDAVRIMTVHKSKGLEFPIVIGIGLEKRIKRGAQGELLLSREFGPGLYLIDEERSTRRQSIAREAADTEQSQRDLAEELRVLYVMLTRAREKLILTGCVKGVPDALERWEFGPVASPGRLLDFVMPATCEMRRTGEALVSITAHPAHNHGIINPVTSFDRALSKIRDAAPDPELTRRMAWKYPYASEVLAPLKLTASALERTVEGPAVMPEYRTRPDFMAAREGLTATERGIAAHSVLQWLELDAIRAAAGEHLLAEITRQLDALRERGTLSDAQRRGVNARYIERFFASEMGRRLLASPEVHREWPFVLRMDAAEALPEGGAPYGRILVQGIIDCCFIENGEWVLLDYKTDRSEEFGELRARYAGQLRLYSRALERITHRRVAARGIYLLRSGEFLPIE